MQKINYQLKMENILNNIQTNCNKPRLLLQACCSPCCCYPIELLDTYFDITIYFYNPNIQPKSEYQIRLEELIRFIPRFMGKKMNILTETYNPQDFFQEVKGFENEPEGGKRCFRCYQQRILQTRNKALELNYDFFGTSLTISPHKNAQYINLLGKNLEKDGLSFLYSDFKKKNGFKRSVEISKLYNLYRQDYCGCIFSRKDIIKKDETKESLLESVIDH